MPDKTCNKSDLLLIATDCQHILEAKGLKMRNPLNGLGVGGFYKNLSTFHFKQKNRITKHLKIHGETRFVDIIDFEHLVDKTISSIAI